MGKINVINNLKDDVIVMVTKNDDITEIVIDVPETEVELFSLEPGTIFEKDGVEYIVCEQLENPKITYVIRKECLKEKIKFGDNNDWATSNCREYLNEVYLKEIEQSFGKYNIITHSVTLISLDGYDDYKGTLDKVSVLTVDRYRKYHKYIGNVEYYNSLSTPYSTPSGISDDCICYVNSSGGLFSNATDYDSAVRPFFVLNSSVLVSVK